MTMHQASPRFRPRPALWAVLLCLLCVVGSRFGMAAATAKPNVLIILADDLGYADLGVHGCKDIPTPHLDRLAASGVRCTSGYSSHPYCSPMRAGLMAGRYQQRFGYERNIAYDPQNAFMGIPAGETLVPARLRTAGYATGAFGKWHLGAAAPFTPNRRGFDFFYGFRGGGHDYFTVDLNRPMGEGYQQPLERNGTPENLTGYLTTRLAEETVAFIERHKEQPFFVYLAFNAPHTPMQAPEAKLEQFAAIPDKKRRAYAAMVGVMDDAVGTVLATLDRLKLRENTLVFFLSDNGGPENANASDNGPLRGQKGDVFEGGIRVPFLVSWPGKLPAGVTFDHPVNSIDVARTALEAGGAPLDQKLEGVNLVPFLAGERQGAPSPALFWRMENGESWAVRAGPLKLVKDKAAQTPSLYDLDADLGETTDLFAQRPVEVKRLQALFDGWNQANIPPFFPGFREYHPAVQKTYQEISAPPKS
jgi:arylsulfatase A-like enzyme